MHKHLHVHEHVELDVHPHIQEVEVGLHTNRLIDRKKLQGSGCGYTIFIYVKYIDINYMKYLIKYIVDINYWNILI